MILRLNSIRRISTTYLKNRNSAILFNRRFRLQENTQRYINFLDEKLKAPADGFSSVQAKVSKNHEITTFKAKKSPEITKKTHNNFNFIQTNAILYTL